MTEDEPIGIDRFSGPCVVCGDTVHGHRYVALGLFGVFDEQSVGVAFQPEEDVAEVDDWDEIVLDRVVHVACLPIYLDGVYLDLRHRQAEAADGAVDEADG